jgi:hypothetical protein
VDDLRIEMTCCNEGRPTAFIAGLKEHRTVMVKYSPDVAHEAAHSIFVRAFVARLENERLVDVGLCLFPTDRQPPVLLLTQDEAFLLARQATDAAHAAMAFDAMARSTRVGLPADEAVYAPAFAG